MSVGDAWQIDRPRWEGRDYHFQVLWKVDLVLGVVQGVKTKIPFSFYCDAHLNGGTNDVRVARPR